MLDQEGDAEITRREFLTGKYLCDDGEGDIRPIPYLLIGGIAYLWYRAYRNEKKRSKDYMRQLGDNTYENSKDSNGITSIEQIVHTHNNM